MNVQSLDTTRRRTELYRRAMSEAGWEEAAIAANLERSWVWRNIFVAPSEAEAERVGDRYFAEMVSSRAEMRNRIYAETGERILVPRNDLPDTRASGGLMRGAPATVAEALAEIEALGIGGVIATFRLGPMPHEVATESLGLFMREVAPQFRV